MDSDHGARDAAELPWVIVNPTSGSGDHAEAIRERAAERGYERVRIAVNNAYSYEALHKGGFAWTGRETGIAELVLERPADQPAVVDPDAYREGLATIVARGDVGDDERAFAERKRERGPPAVDDGVLG